MYADAITLYQEALGLYTQVSACATVRAVLLARCAWCRWIDTVLAYFGHDVLTHPPPLAVFTTGVRPARQGKYEEALAQHTKSYVYIHTYV